MYAWLWTYVRKYRWHYAAGLALALVITGVNLISPFLTGLLVGQVVIGRHSELLAGYLAILVGAIALKSVVRYGYQMMFEHVSQNIIRAIREGLFKRIQGMDFGYFDRTKTGDLMAHMTGDIEAVRHFLAWVVYQSWEQATTFVVSTVALFIIDWQFTLALLAAAPPIGFCAWRLSKRIKPTFGRIRDQFSRLNSVVQENIAGNRVVKALAREDHETAKFAAENDAYRERNLEMARVLMRYLPLIEFFSGLLPVVLILVGGILIILGRMDITQWVTFNGLVWALNNPMRMTGQLASDTQRFRASCERLHRLDQIESRLAEPARPDPDLPRRLGGGVAFRGVDFSYGDEPVLRGIDFAVEPGQTVGILGPTGSGKSTLVKLLCRYYDVDAGAILLDGRDLRELPLATVRRTVGVTMQDVFLFSDTIAGNIAFGNPGADRDAIIKAASLANAHEFVKDLPEGYDTIVGERGVGLSGGQRQRLTLARLLLDAPPVLVLDDTTSAVDIETEERIQHAIRGLRGKHTMFIVAHRLSSVMHADLILVLEDGRIAERGRHDELVAAGGRYAEIYRHQTEAGEVGRGA